MKGIYFNGIIVVILMGMCYSKIHPDPTMIRDSLITIVNTVTDFEGEYVINFKQELPLRDIQIPFTFDLIPDIQNITIDIGRKEVLIPNDYTIISPSTIPNSIIYNDKNISCFSHEGIVTIGSMKKRCLGTKLTLYSINSKIINKAYFGLGRLSPNDNDDGALINILFSIKHISSRQFTITHSYPDWGSITFGKQSQFVQDQPHLVKACPIIETQHTEKWACKLEGIFFGDVTPTQNDSHETLYIIDPFKNKAISLNAFAFFDTIEAYIVSPYIFSQFLKRHYFNTFLLESTCYYEQNNQHASFYCKKTIIDKFDIISFSFGVFGLCYYPKTLFINTPLKDYNKFIIVGNMKDKKTKDWILGDTFMSIFSTTFNYDDNTVSFFSLLGKINLSSIKYYYDINDKSLLSNKSSIKSLLIMLIIVGLISISFLAFVHKSYCYKYI